MYIATTLSLIHGAFYAMSYACEAGQIEPQEVWATR